MDLPHIELTEPPQIYLNVAPWEWSTQIPNYYNLWYALEGRGRIAINDESFEIEPGRLFLLAPGTRVFATHKPANEIRNFTAHFNFLSSTPLTRRLEMEPMYNLIVPSKSAIEQRMQEAWARGRTDDSLSRREAEALVFLILADLFRLHHTRLLPFADNRLESLLNLIDAQPGSFIKLEELCNVSGISTAQLRRLFTKRTGMSPVAYLTKRRLERACHLLADSSLSISAIANSLGYDDPLYFSRVFKKGIGQSPRSWRHSRP